MEELKSGDRFYYKGDKDCKYPYWYLQKLPDFDIWILVRPFNELNFGRMSDHWCAPGSTPLEAFGGCFDKFERI